MLIAEQQWKRMVFEGFNYLLDLNSIEFGEKEICENEIVIYEEAVCALYDDAEFKSFVETFGYEYDGDLKIIEGKFDALLCLKLSSDEAVKAQEFHDLCNEVRRFVSKHGLP